MGGRIGLLTLGCKVNQSETTGIEKSLSGFKLVPFREEADYYVINTCSVTARTDRKSREYIRRALKTGRKAKVIVTGCYSQRAAEELKLISPRVVLFPNDRKKDIPEYIFPI